MKNPIALRFGIAGGLVTAGCLLLLAGFSSASVLFGLATVFFMPRSELMSAIPRRELWLIFGGMFALVVVANIGKQLFPSSSSVVMERIICHPAFVVPLWLFMLWGLFRHWQKQKAGLEV